MATQESTKEKAPSLGRSDTAKTLAHSSSSSASSSHGNIFPNDHTNPKLNTSSPSTGSPDAPTDTTADAPVSKSFKESWGPYLFIPLVIILGFSYSMEDLNAMWDAYGGSKEDVEGENAMHFARMVKILMRLCQTYQKEEALSSFPALFPDTSAQFNLFQTSNNFYLFNNGTSPSPSPTPSGCASPEVQRYIAQFKASLGAALVLPMETWLPFLIANYKLPMSLFFISRIMMGFAGGIAVAASVGFASLVDITTTENRTKVIGIMSGTGTVVNIIGVTLGGVITGKGVNIEDFLPVFRISATLSTIGIFYLVFVIPETLQRKPATASEILAEWKESFKASRNSESGWGDYIKRQSAAFRYLPAVVVALQILGASTIVKGMFLVQYANAKFGWTTPEASLFSLAETFMSGILMAGIIPLCERLLRKFYTRKSGNQSTSESEGVVPGTAASSTEVLADEVHPSTATETTPLVSPNPTPSETHSKRILTVRIHLRLLLITLTGALIGCLIYALAHTDKIWYMALPLFMLSQASSLSIRLITYEYVSPKNIAYVGSVLTLVDSVVIVVNQQIGARIYPHFFYLAAGIYAVMIVLAVWGRGTGGVPDFDEDEVKKEEPVTAA
ncbi:hypothetical protein HDV05_004503 [Chytridiales sp. JEL 0842]|nr:hypothetical protein HDV05_004503 [Chytridiales sp. JEL 0842]